MLLWEIYGEAAMADENIPVKYKVLLAVVVAHSTQCPCCEDIHAPNARKQGAGDVELLEGQCGSSCQWTCYP